MRSKWDNNTHASPLGKFLSSNTQDFIEVGERMHDICDERDS